jgi:hypothetical protein
MIIDSNSFGWLLATGIAVYIISKNWKRFVKLLIFAGAAMFVLFVVQLKTMYDAVLDTETPTTTKKDEIEIKADLDTLNKTIHIKEVEVRRNK